MKKHRKLIIFLIILVFLIALPVACGQKYPNKLTKEEVMENYHKIDQNLIYLQGKRRDSRRSIASYGTINIWREIKGVPSDKFIAIDSTVWIFNGDVWEGYIVAHHDNDENPIYDYHINKIEIYLRNDYTTGVGYKFDSEYKLKKFGKYIYRQNLALIEDAAVMDEIIRCARRSADDSARIVEPLKGDSGILTLRIHFDEYKNIVWDADIAEFEGKYYLILLDPQTKEPAYYFSNSILCYVGPNFDAFMTTFLNESK